MLWSSLIQVVIVVEVVVVVEEEEGEVVVVLAVVEYSMPFTAPAKKDWRSCI